MTGGTWRVDSRLVLVHATTALPQDTDADTAVIGVLEDEKIHHDIDGVLNGLVEAGEAKAKHRHLAVTHAGAKRWILVGLGKRSELDGERVRCAAASALGRARELGARRLCWEVPHKVEDEIAAAIVEGTLLTAYRYDRFKGKESDDDEENERKDIDALLVSAHDDMASVAADAEIVASAVNAARDLQNAPPNEMAPRHVADAARALGELDGVSVEVEGRDGQRTVGLDELMVDAYATSLAEDEVVTRIVVPVPEPAVRIGYEKFNIHERPTLGLAVVLETADGGEAISGARAALGCVSPTPRRSATAEGLIAGSRSDLDSRLDDAAEALAEDADLIDDAEGSTDYKRQLIRVFLRRAVRNALAEPAALN